MQGISTPMRLSVISTIAATALFLVAPAAQAAVVIFDDAYGSGWSGSWRMNTQGDNVHSGSQALGTSDNGQFEFSHEGFVDASNHILEFYVNTTDATLASHLYIQMTWTDADDTLHDALIFGTRNVAAVYMIDGTPVEPPISLDTDTSTWQKVQLDLSQTIYTGWPYEAHAYVPGESTITQIRFLTSGGGQSLNVIMDNVRFVPEPASLSLLGLAVGGLLRRRRR